MADELVVMCSGAFIGVLSKLLSEFQREAGLVVKTIHGPSIGTTPRAIPVRLRGGETSDLVILFDDVIDILVDDGLVLPGTKVRIASSGIGVAIRSDASKSDISSVDALRRTILASQSFAYSSSASGIYVSSELLRRLQLPDEVGQKGFRVEGEPVGRVVARGDAEFGFQQMSELLPIEGIAVLGPLPAGVQKFTLLSAALPKDVRHIVGARALIDYLTSEKVRPILLDAGLGLDFTT